METWDGATTGPSYNNAAGFGTYGNYGGQKARGGPTGTYGRANTAASGSSAGSPYRSGSGFGHYDTYGGGAGAANGRGPAPPQGQTSGARPRGYDSFFDGSRVGTSAANGRGPAPPQGQTSGARPRGYDSFFDGSKVGTSAANGRGPVPPRGPPNGPPPRGYDSFFNERVSNMGTGVYGRGTTQPKGPVGASRAGVGAGHRGREATQPRGTVVDGTKRPRGPVVVGDDVKVKLKIDFKTGVFGGEKKVEINHLELCDTCTGSGAKPGSTVFTCVACGGAKRTPLGNFQARQDCPICNGTGQQIQEFCGTCNGKGVQQKAKQVTVKIPPKFDREWIRVPGEGDAGPHGGPSGDLYVYPKVEDVKIKNEKEASSESEGGFLLKTWRRVKGVVRRRKGNKTAQQVRP